MTGKRGTKRGPRVTRTGDGPSHADPKSLRQKAEKTYVDGMDSDSDDEPFKQTFSVEEKLASKKFPQHAQYFIKELKGEEVDLAYFQRTGFTMPILVKEKTGLGMTVPDSTFTVSDVRSYVGARRTIEAMDCATQRNSEMTMKDFEDYYNGTNREKLLNVISLEFSFTKLEQHVIAPRAVRQVDFVDNVWPRHLKEQQSDSTNDMREMKYPKVQKYCLMSVNGCYTDFHIDFGGSSVWYHIIKGKKVFWMVPPTEVNLKAYEQWTLSGKQGDIFFGDMVEKCGMITLEAGNTFFIPSGWIHAVFTPEDSLVFGGNFLHPYAIEKQIRVAQIEEATKVPQKFRFPFFTELHWYLLDKYVYALLGRTHLCFTDETKDHLLGDPAERQSHLESLSTHKPHITPQELFGLKAIIMYIHALAVSKKCVPFLLRKPINLVKDVRIVVDEHKDDEMSSAVTGRQLLHWPGIKVDPGFNKVKGKKRDRTKDFYTIKNRGKQERGPCKICQACISPDCGQCPSCADMIRYGGPGRLRQPCQMRQCLQPLLDLAITCNVCGLDGWYAAPNMRLVDRPPGTCALMECCICFEVTHPTCLTDYGVDGFIKMDVPNSWECPKCIKVKEEDEPSPTKQIKKEEEDPPLRKAISTGSDASFSGYQLFSVKGRSDQPKHELRVQLAEQIMTASTTPMKHPKYVVRPPPLDRTASELVERRKKNPDLNLLLEPVILLPVFHRLGSVDLAKCALVCKAWNQIAQDPCLWYTVKLPHRKITSRILSLIVQRQPLKLVLDFSTIGRQQLQWLLPRLPQTKTLSLGGLEYNSSVVALNTVHAPMLQELDVSFVTNFNDASLFKILASPSNSRPGLLDKKSRQKLLRKLCLSGTEISDVGLRYITQYLPQLNCLQISGCWKVTDAGLAQLSSPEAKTVDTLVSLDVSACRQVTNAGLTHLTRCRNLVSVNCGMTGITVEGMKRFVEENKEKLRIYGSAVIDRKIVSTAKNGQD